MFPRLHSKNVEKEHILPLETLLSKQPHTHAHTHTQARTHMRVGAHTHMHARTLVMGERSSYGLLCPKPSNDDEPRLPAGGQTTGHSNVLLGKL